MAGAKGLEPSTSAVTGQRPRRKIKADSTPARAKAARKAHDSTPESKRRKPSTGPLTAAMAFALGAAIEHGGKLVRFTGYWSWAGNVSARKDDRFSVETIDALAQRGRLVYTEYKDDRGVRFPIVAQVVP